jgi:glycine cleavage system protein P-like pyridoxal-binding family
MHKELESLLSHITGFDSVSLQPNAGAQVQALALLTGHRPLADAEGPILPGRICGAAVY